MGVGENLGVRGVMPASACLARCCLRNQRFLLKRTVFAEGPSVDVSRRSCSSARAGATYR